MHQQQMADIVSQDNSIAKHRFVMVEDSTVHNVTVEDGTVHNVPDRYSGNKCFLVVTQHYEAFFLELVQHF